LVLLPVVLNAKSAYKADQKCIWTNAVKITVLTYLDDRLFPFELGAFWGFYAADYTSLTLFWGSIEVGPS
jgi:hypothetical protein